MIQRERKIHKIKSRLDRMNNPEQISMTLINDVKDYFIQNLYKTFIKKLIKLFNTFWGLI